MAKTITAELLRNHYQGRSVLVTGSTGFKGSWLCRMLVHLGAKVHGYALRPPTAPSLWDIAGLDDMVSQTYADIRNVDALADAFASAQATAVLHLAAQPLVIDSYVDPRHTYDVNVMGTVNALECARSCASVGSFLNVTTDKVYLNRERSDYAYREDDPLDGHDPYSSSKSCSELLTHSYARSFFAPDARGNAAGRCAVSTARAGNVIGGGDFAANRIVPDCVRAATTGTTMVVRNPHSVRPYQHVLEACGAYLGLVALQASDDGKAGWYNIGPDAEGCVTTGTVVSMFASAWGNGFAYEIHHVDGPHEAACLMLDNDKARRELGWHPVWNVAEAVNRTVAWTLAWLQGGESAATTTMDTHIEEYLEAL